MDEHKEELPQESATEEKKSSRRRLTISKTAYYTLLAVFMSVIVLCGVYIAGYFWQTESAKKDYETLEDLYLQGTSQPVSTGTPSTRPTNPTNPTNPSNPTGPTDPTEPQAPVMLPSLQPIYALNSDTVGYLRFNNGVSISYPVMQSPYDEDFYLTHKFDKTPNTDVAIGCPYVPMGCDVFTPSDNVIIYGHYLRSGGMFAPLAQYTDKNFWKTHQTFTFDTLYEQHTYQIFAVFKTAARQNLKDGTPWGYPYHRQINFDSAEEFDQFIRDIKGDAFEKDDYMGWSCYETGIYPQYGDKLLCLSTCEYSIKDPYSGDWDGRLVIMAMRVD